MNSGNDTVVSPEMMKALREAKLDGGYEPVPAELESKARRLLGNNAIASMDGDMKRKVRNLKKRMRREGAPGY